MFLIQESPTQTKTSCKKPMSSSTNPQSPKQQGKRLTTEAGAPVIDNQNILTAGPHGPSLLQDVW